MVNWRIIRKYALVSGIVFIVFSVLAGIVNYELDKLLYSSAAPVRFIDYNIISAMLPLLAFAVISFIIVALSSFEIRSESTEEPEEKETPQTETQSEMEEVSEEPEETSEETQT